MATRVILYRPSVGVPLTWNIRRRASAGGPTRSFGPASCPNASGASPVRSSVPIRDSIAWRLSETRDHNIL